MTHRAILPPGWPRPKGYSNGMIGRGQVLAIAGQIGWDEEEKLVEGGFIPQFRRAMRNVVTIVEAAGGTPQDIVSLTLYVTDKAPYLEEIETVGVIYRELMGKHYPAMSLLQVSALLESRAVIEIEGLAVLAEA